jgi:hypothetical protein
MQGQRCVLGANSDRFLYAPDAARRGLIRDTRGEKHFDKAPRGAIESGRLWGIDLDHAIIDTQAGERRQDMLHERYLDGSVAQRRPTIGSRDLMDVGGKAWVTGQVGAHENDAMGRRGRQKAESDFGPRKKPHAGDDGGASEGALRTGGVPSHNWRPSTS